MENEIIIQTEDFNILVNPLLECLGVVFILSDFKLNKVRTNTEYIEKIKEHFTPHKEHPLVLKFKKLLEEPEFKYDTPLQMVLNMFHNEKPSQELLMRAHINIKQYNSLYECFIDFIKVTDFNHFFNKNKEFYIDSIQQFIKDIKPYSPHKYLFDFLGLKSDNLNIILMFGISTANYGISVDKQLYCCVRPYKQSRFKDKIDFCFNLPYMTTLILHEFAHSFINSITSDYAKHIEKIDQKHFAEAFEKNPYGAHKETVINETIIRTIECIYLKEFFIENYADIKEEYINDGFVYIPNIEELFNHYLTNRTKYKNIKNFYAQLINEFNNNIKL